MNTQHSQLQNHQVNDQGIYQQQFEVQEHHNQDIKDHFLQTSNSLEQSHKINESSQNDYISQTFSSECQQYPQPEVKEQVNQIQQMTQPVQRQIQPVNKQTDPPQIVLSAQERAKKLLEQSQKLLQQSKKQTEIKQQPIQQNIVQSSQSQQLQGPLPRQQQISLPNSTQNHSEQINPSIQPPKNTQFQSQSPKNTEFQSQPPKSTEFSNPPPKSTQFQSQPPKSTELSNPPPKSTEFINQAPKSTEFQSQLQKSTEFQSQLQKSTEFQSQPPKSTQFQSQPLKNAEFQSQPPQSIEFQTQLHQNPQFVEENITQNPENIRSELAKQQLVQEVPVIQSLFQPPPNNQQRPIQQLNRKQGPQVPVRRPPMNSAFQEPSVQATQTNQQQSSNARNDNQTQEIPKINEQLTLQSTQFAVLDPKQIKPQLPNQIQQIPNNQENQQNQVILNSHSPSNYEKQPLTQIACWNLINGLSKIQINENLKLERYQIKTDELKNYPGPVLLKSVSKQIKEEYTKKFTKFWERIEENEKSFFKIVIKCYLNLSYKSLEANLLDINLQELRSQLLFQIEEEYMRTEEGINFLSVFQQVFDNIEHSDCWDLVLLLNLGLQQDQIKIHQQEGLIRYLKNRPYANEQEAIILMLACILKMEPNKLKSDEFLTKYCALISEEGQEQNFVFLVLSSEHFMIRLLWIALKLYPQYTNKTNLKDICLEIMNNKLLFNTSFVPVVMQMFNLILGGTLSNQLVDMPLSQLNFLFLETVAFRYNIQLPGQFYYKFAQLQCDLNYHRKSLDTLRVCLELQYIPGRELRDRVIHILEVVENPQNYEEQQQKGPASGLFGFFNQTIKTMTEVKSKPQQTSQQEEKKSNFYYDHQLKGWVIDGVLASEEYDYGTAPPSSQNNTGSGGILPPPTKIGGQNPVQVPPPQQTLPKPIANTTPIPQTGKQQTPNVPSSNPFGNAVSHIDDGGKTQKKTNLMRNRYVQQ